MPAPEQENRESHPPDPKPGLWQRIKNAAEEHPILAVALGVFIVAGIGAALFFTMGTAALVAGGMALASAAVAHVTDVPGFVAGLTIDRVANEAMDKAEESVTDTQETNKPNPELLNRSQNVTQDFSKGSAQFAADKSSPNNIHTQQDIALVKRKSEDMAPQPNSNISPETTPTEPNNAQKEKTLIIDERQH